ncbi:MAG: hypothetical protein JKY95_13035 [Planctomycetaceae bacterium]|nr:hypothetical protein [Planctomycetaceae bacterium]
MSRLSLFTTTICTAAFVFANQMSVSGQEVQQADGNDNAGVVRIVSHKNSTRQIPGLISEAIEAKPISSLRVIPVSRSHANNVTNLGPAAHGYGGYRCYPQVNAPLYPSPQPHVPTYAGGTMITNQAFSPHEMLYPHTYKAMYGPYYYKVRGSWITTPWGVRSHDRWELQGTEVTVKYRSHDKLFSFPQW